MSLNNGRELVEGIGQAFGAIGNRFDKLLARTHQPLGEMNHMSTENRATFHLLADQVQNCNRNSLALPSGNKSHTHWAEAVNTFVERLDNEMSGLKIIERFFSLCH